MLKSMVVETLSVKRLTRREAIRSFIYTIVGASSATIGLNCFLLPNSFLDGGITGVSLLTSHVTGFSFSWLLFLLNIPFLFIGYKQIGVKFARRATFAILLLAILTHSLTLPTATYDPILIAVFGGFFLGLGIGLTIRGGGVIDGTEVLAVHISRNSSLSVGDFILLFNIVLFILAGFIIDLETAMYSMLTYMAASKTVDFVITGIEEYIGVTIISEKSAEIKAAIIEEMKLAVTAYKAEGGYGDSGRHDHEKVVLFSVVTRLEVQKLRAEVERIDRHAFVIQHVISDSRGGTLKRRPLH